MPLMHHGTHDPLAHAVTDTFHILYHFGINAINSLDKQGAPVVIKQRHQAILHVRDITQRLQHTAQGIFHIQRTAEYDTDLMQGIQLLLHAETFISAGGKQAGLCVHFLSSLIMVHRGNLSRIQLPPKSLVSTSITPL